MNRDRIVGRIRVAFVLEGLFAWIVCSLGYVVAAGYLDISGGENQVKAIFVICMFLSVFMGILTCRRIRKAVEKPTKLLEDIATELAMGNANIDINIKTEEEFRRVFIRFDEACESIKKHAEIAEEIAGGDLDIEVPVRSEKDVPDRWQVPVRH